MVRSGIQKEVISLYRQGVRNALSKPAEARENFLLHLRYNFHNPRLNTRDYSAIEHQMRKMTRTIEMLSENSVRRVGTTSEMEDWWTGEVERSRSSDKEAKRRKEGDGEQAGQAESSGRRSEEKGHDGKSVADRGDSDLGTQQWGGALPGHGGT